ncbi:MAG: efflux RND transporter periplasmic adaptor subunit [Acidobacteriota bacterium]|nr:efflux RND transporter periplasmic adaptor subunit [Acidobacteriota bacterium]
MKRFPSPIFLLLLLLALALPLATTGCSHSSTEAGEASSEESGDQGEDGSTEEEKEDTSVPVELTTLETGSIEAVLRYSTNLEAESSVQVLAEANRKVRQLLVEEGDRVRRGQVLVRLQDDEQRTTLAKVQSELDKVGRDYDRQKRLYEQGFLSEEDYSDATYQIEQLQLRLEEAQRELSYTEVTAPIDGTVTARMINLGDFVTINQPLFELVDFDSIVARVFVPEKELSSLATGQEARLTTPAVSDQIHSGSIERIAPVVDPKSGTVKVTVALDNPRALRPGLYVDVALVTAVHENALLIPKRALVYDQDQIFVYRLADVSSGDAAEEQTVERVRVEPELEDKIFMEPRGDRLSAGDRLVVAGQAGLKDGAEVRILQSVGEAARAAANGLPSRNDADADASAREAE